jgi:uncharacterized protein
MISSLARLAVPVTATILFCGFAEAASFDCSKGKQPVEKAICASQVLSDLDVEMATLYRVRMQLPMLMGARGAAQDEQHQFLAERGACGGSAVCIQTKYQARIGVLRQTIEAAMKDYCVKSGICG